MPDRDMRLESDRQVNDWPHWPDARGWIGIGVFLLTIMVLWMVKEDAELRENEFFKVLATLIVGAFIKDVVGWAYSATKQGGELADKNATIVNDSAKAAVAASTKLGSDSSALSGSDGTGKSPENPAFVKEVKPLPMDPNDPAYEIQSEEHAAQLLSQAEAEGDPIVIEFVKAAIDRWRKSQAG